MFDAFKSILGLSLSSNSPFILQCPVCVHTSIMVAIALYIRDALACVSSLSGKPSVHLVHVHRACLHTHKTALHKIYYLSSPASIVPDLAYIYPALSIDILGNCWPALPFNIIPLNWFVLYIVMECVVLAWQPLTAHINFIPVVCKSRFLFQLSHVASHMSHRVTTSRSRGHMQAGSLWPPASLAF